MTNSFAFVRSAEVDGKHYVYGEYPVELAPLCYYGQSLNTLVLEMADTPEDNAKVDIKQVLTFPSKIDRTASQVVPNDGIVEGIIILESQQNNQGSQPSNNRIRLFRLFLHKSSISSELEIKEIDIMQLGQGIFQDYGWSKPRN